MKNCEDHDRCVEEITAAAERICDSRGLRLTPLRKQVLEIVSRNHHRLLKAYDILGALSKSAKPPTVYRALDFLIKNGLVHKLSSVSSYVPCFHSESGHEECFFLVCSACGNAGEFCGESLSRAIDNAAALEGFGKKKASLEVWGVCADCVGAGT